MALNIPGALNALRALARRTITGHDPAPHPHAPHRLHVHRLNQHQRATNQPHHRTPPPDDDPADAAGAAPVDSTPEATLGVSSASMSDRRKCIRPDGYLTTGIKPSRAQRHS